MPRFRCYNCPDRRPGRGGYFREFESDRPSCPHCGAGAQAVAPLVDVHFLLPDAAGPIWGKGGTRWRIGCQPRREILAVSTSDSFSVSHDVQAVTCPSCRGLPAFQQEFKAVVATTGSVFHIDEGGCCG